MMETQQTLVKDLRPGSKNLCMVIIVLDIGKPSTTKDGHEVRTIRVADKSGSINLSIWDEPGTLVQSGDILRINKAYASLFKNSLTLYIGKGGELHKVGDFCLLFSELPNMSEESFPPNIPGLSGQSGVGGVGGGGSGGPGSNLPGGGGGPPMGDKGGNPGNRDRDRPPFKNGNSRPIKHQSNHNSVFNSSHPYDMSSHSKVIRK